MARPGPSRQQVPRRQSSYAAFRLPRPHGPRLQFPLPTAYLDPSRRGEDLPGYWAVLFVRAMVKHPAGYDPSLPLPLFERIHGEVVVAFRANRTLGIRKVIVFEAASPHGSHARVPTLRQPRYRDRRKARYRLGRAHPWPGRFRTVGTTNEVSRRLRTSYYPNRPAEPGRTEVTIRFHRVGAQDVLPHSPQILRSGRLLPFQLDGLEWRRFSRSSVRASFSWSPRSRCW